MSVMKTPEEAVKDFILKNIDNQRGRWDLGRKNTFFAWERYKDEFNELCSNSASLKEEFRLAEEYIASKGLKTEFRKWKELKRHGDE